MRFIPDDLAAYSHQIKKIGNIPAEFRKRIAPSKEKDHPEQNEQKEKRYFDEITQQVKQEPANAKLFPDP
jgi:hypothetical protein